MTITRDDILQLFEQLTTMGLRIPPEVNSNLEMAADGYLLVLGDLSPEDLRGALFAFARSGKQFWPSAPEFRSLAPRLASTKQDRSEEAWGLLMRMMGSPGCDRLEQMQVAGEAWLQDTEMDRRMKHAAQAAGGVRHLGRCDISEQMANRASFRAAYREAQQREEITGRPIALETRGSKVVRFPKASSSQLPDKAG